VINLSNTTEFVIPLGPIIKSVLKPAKLREIG
jgi:hypothetical protein